MDDPYLAKLGSLVRKIYLKTQDGTIRWEPEAFEDTIFEALVAGRKTTIGFIDYQSEDGEPVRDAEISIYNDEGRKIESIRDTMLWSIELGVEGFSGWFSLMTAIFDTAKRQANGSEDAINKMLESLDDPYF